MSDGIYKSCVPVLLQRRQEALEAERRRAEVEAARAREVEEFRHFVSTLQAAVERERVERFLSTFANH